MIKNILWDFDGVIIDNMPIRDYGFRKVFENYSNEIVEEFIQYHRLNGGLSRFHKIKYFYNTLLNEEISKEHIQEYAEKFTVIMKEELINKKYLIQYSSDLVKNLLEKEKYKKNETILIDDSINDYNSAKTNGIYFYGFNNKDLQKYSKVYINAFDEMSFNE